MHKAVDKPWKKWERECAAIIGGRRHPANMGGKVDVESDAIVGQAKEVKVLPLVELTRLAVEIESEAKKKSKEGVVFVKHKPGRGHDATGLVVMTTETFVHFISGGGTW